MIKEILKYDLRKLPQDAMCFVETKEFIIILLSIIYAILMISVAFLLVKLIRYNMTVSIIVIPVVYLWCVAANYAVAKICKYLFYLDKYKCQPTNLKIVLFILSGPFGLLKAGYLTMCLQTMLDSQQFRLISKSGSRFWHHIVEEENQESNFLLSLAKYQKRLKDYS